ncbi:MAG: UDP-N-acetylmuramoyl-tripeptide--D-alanyl-D-alanine ligase [Methylococcaceae bacterium]|jgi:UDP-N-acetylmuramoyl-tripeptide--D-alanyl-D-alanine ligase
MMDIKLSEIAQIVNATLQGDDAVISSVSIDTRTLSKGDLYIAITGPNFDGNDFITLAEQVGAAAAIVSKDSQARIPLLKVADCRIALGQLASAWRHKAMVPVVGMTGSNGKTTVKEMVAAILAVKGQVLFTKGNLNNDIGVPLTLLRLTDQDDFAVIEMGANHPGEIAYTSALVQADVVIITNVGPAHIEGFGSVAGVAKAKGEIVSSLRDSGVAVLNRDDCYFDYWTSLANGKAVYSFGFDANADITAQNITHELKPLLDGQISSAECEHVEFATCFELLTRHGAIAISLKLAGRHNVLNALAAAAAAMALGLGLEQIKQGLESVKPVTGRLQPLLGVHGNLIIDDTYNANSASLSAALDVLAACPGEHVLVLGAFGELGDESQKIHQQIGKQIKDSGVSKLLAVGAQARHSVEAYGMGGEYFESQDELISALEKQLNNKQTILLKGSRSQRMENVAATLVKNFRM